jgi:hypothetical protein
MDSFKPAGWLLDNALDLTQRAVCHYSCLSNHSLITPSDSAVMV